MNGSIFEIYHDIRHLLGVDEDTMALIAVTVFYGCILVYVWTQKAYRPATRNRTYAISYHEAVAAGYPWIYDGLDDKGNPKATSLNLLRGLGGKSGLGKCCTLAYQLDMSKRSAGSDAHRSLDEAFRRAPPPLLSDPDEPAADENLAATKEDGT